MDANGDKLSRVKCKVSLSHKSYMYNVHVHHKTTLEINILTVIYLQCFALEVLSKSVNPRSLLEKLVTRSLEGGGAKSDPPSTFDTIHPIELKFVTYSKLHLYFQLSKTMWCLIGFHGNNSQINDVTGSCHLGFSNFQILLKFSLLYLRLRGKQHLAVEIREIGRIHCEVVRI